MKLIKCLAICILVFTFTTIDAQITYGVKAGVQMTNITKYHGFSESRTGFQIGGFAKIPLDDYDKMYLQPEVLYLTHGEKNNGDGYSENYFINYIAVPVLLKRYLSDNENAVYLEGGPTFMLKVSQNTDSSFSTPLYNGDKDKVAGFDISLGLGLGYSIDRTYDIGVRYNYGFTDVYPKADGESTGKTNGTSNIQLSLGFTF